VASRHVEPEELGPLLQGPVGAQPALEHRFHEGAADPGFCVRHRLLPEEVQAHHQGCVLGRPHVHVAEGLPWAGHQDKVRGSRGARADWPAQQGRTVLQHGDCLLPGGLKGGEGAQESAGQGLVPGQQAASGIQDEHLAPQQPFQPRLDVRHRLRLQGSLRELPVDAFGPFQGLEMGADDGPVDGLR